MLVQEKQAEASPAQVSGIPRTSSVSETDQSDSELNPEVLQKHRKNLKSSNSSGLLNEPAQQAKYVEPITGKGRKNTVLLAGLKPVVIQDARPRSFSDSFCADKGSFSDSSGADS